MLGAEDLYTQALVSSYCRHRRLPQTILAISLIPFIIIGFGDLIQFSSALRKTAYLMFLCILLNLLAVEMWNQT